MLILSVQAMTSEQRKKILLDIADAIEANAKKIIVENEADVSAAQQAGYEKSLISRLALKSGKVKQTNFAKLLRTKICFCLMLRIMFLLDHTPTYVRESAFYT